MGDRYYNYEQAAANPGVLAFLIGWTAQQICYLESVSLDHVLEEEDKYSMHWEVVKWNTWRLAYICDAWVRRTGRPFPAELGLKLQDLIAWGDGDGWECNRQKFGCKPAWKTIALFPFGDGVNLGKQMFFPSLLDASSKRSDGLVSCWETLSAFIKGIGQQIGCSREIELGVSLSGFCHARYTRDIVNDLPTILDRAITLGLLNEGTCERFLPRKGVDYRTFSATEAEALPNKNWLDFHDELRQLPEILCANQGIVASSEDGESYERPSEEMLARVFAGPSVKPARARRQSDVALDGQTNPPAVADTRNKKTKRTTQQIDSFEKNAGKIEKSVDRLARAVEDMAANGKTPKKARRGGTPKGEPGCKGIGGDEESFRLIVLHAWQKAKEAGVDCKTFSKEYERYILEWVKSHQGFRLPAQLTAKEIDTFQKWRKTRQDRKAMGGRPVSKATTV